jgi:CRP/FNR family transcriptional regulator, cyclic AMP receptor protein
LAAEPSSSSQYHIVSETHHILALGRSFVTVTANRQLDDSSAGSRKRRTRFCFETRSKTGKLWHSFCLTITELDVQQAGSLASGRTRTPTHGRRNNQPSPKVVAGEDQPMELEFVLLANRYPPSISTMFGQALGVLAPVSTPLLPRPADDVLPAPKLTSISPRRPCLLDPIAAAGVTSQPAPETARQEIDPFYLFACHVEWEKREEPSAAWELLAAAQSSHSDTRAHARALLASSHHFGACSAAAVPACPAKPDRSDGVADMKAPYGLQIIENCNTCFCVRPGFFCAFPPPIVQALDRVSHKSTLPAGAILFVEGQIPHGVFVLCSGRVNLSTTSREGKILILKTAEAGEAVGLGAAISGAGYESTAETATPCQLNFVDREHLLELMQTYSEVSMRAAHALSRDFHDAYRDIHDLVLSRSSAGKLARLLLSQPPEKDDGTGELRIPTSMTHEEMAQRIGSSRETVTRLLSNLRRKRLIHLDGPTMVIRDRDALEALAV